MPIHTAQILAGSTRRMIFGTSPFGNAWIVGGSYLSHTKNVKTEITKYIAALKINSYYRITYEVYDYVNCTVQLKVGSTFGIIRSSAGVYSELFMINNDLDRKITFIANGILKVKNIQYEEKIFSFDDIFFEDSSQFENKSWTISYSLKDKRERWLSWHSYIPNYYIGTQNNFYSYLARFTQLWKHNMVGNFTKFYGVKYDFIFEYVAVANALQNKILNDIVLQTIARKWDSATKQFINERFITFNHITVYNETQCTGELALVVKDTQALPEDWYQQQIVNNNDVLITNKNGDWNINNFRNYVDDYTKPIFTKSWNDIKNNYFIDKIINNLAINYNKNWNELESFTGKFVSIRLKFSTFDDVNLIVNYAIEEQQTSFR